MIKIFLSIYKFCLVIFVSFPDSGDRAQSYEKDLSRLMFLDYDDSLHLTADADMNFIAR